jgi:hypothetical protein
MIDSIDSEKKYYFLNLSKDKKYLTQRDNIIKPFSTCNTTSVIMALQYSGVILPPKKELDQYEDLLTDFLLKDSRVDAFYKKTDLKNYSEWKDNPNGKYVIPPNEYHVVLAYGTNLWLDSLAPIIKFTTQSSIQEIAFNLIKKRVCVVSGVWSGLRHIVCVVGLKSFQENLEFINRQSDIDLSKIQSFIIDDPFGDYKSFYKNTNGNDIEVPINEFINNTRDLGKTTNKWAHFIYPREGEGNSG